MFDLELEVALRAATAAAEIARRAQPLISAGSLPKPDGSPVTIADYAGQAAACRIIAAAFPNDPIVAEESAQALRSSGSDEALAAVTRLVQDHLGDDVNAEQVAAWIDLGSKREGGARFWTLDPIDGTRGYMNRGHYCSALALIENGRVVVGVLGCPTAALGRPIETAPSPGDGALYYAVRGNGAYAVDFAATAEPVVLKTSEHSDVPTARLCQRRTADQAQPTIVALRRQLGMNGPVLSADSQVKYAAIARGDGDIYVRPRKHAAHRDKIWDHAAGSLLVEEAGGQVTDLAGQPLDFTRGSELTANHGILVTNRRLHAAALAGAAAAGIVA